jgi:hypothetical protein
MGEYMGHCEILRHVLNRNVNATGSNDVADPLGRPHWKDLLAYFVTKLS